MLQLTPQMRILVAVEPVDFRRGIDGLCRVCRTTLGSEPLSGTVFVFRSRQGTSNQASCVRWPGILVVSEAIFGWPRSILAAG